jgi:hypothetical protein
MTTPNAAHLTPVSSAPSAWPVLLFHTNGDVYEVNSLKHWETTLLHLNNFAGWRLRNAPTPNAAHAETPRPTPRTDEAMCRMNIAMTHIEIDGVSAGFARLLETELQAERRRGDALAVALRAARKQILERNGLCRDSDAAAALQINAVLTAHAEGKHQ